jgi:hypothetical protein
MSGMKPSVKTKSPVAKGTRRQVGKSIELVSPTTYIALRVDRPKRGVLSGSADAVEKSRRVSMGPVHDEAASGWGGAGRRRRWWGVTESVAPTR